MGRSVLQRPGRREEDGQTLVEFAIVLPIFLLVVFGLIDAGRFVYTSSALSQAAREGARVAAAEASWVGVPGSACVSDASGIGSGNPGAHVCPPDISALKSDVVSAANRMAVSLGPVTDVHISCNEASETDPTPSGPWTELPGGGGNGCADASGSAISSSGDLVSVRVEYTYQPFTPFVSSFIGSLQLSGSASMVIH